MENKEYRDIEYGKALQKLRKKHKLTQQQLCGILGVSIKHVCNCEQGYRRLSYKAAQKLCAFFNEDFVSTFGRFYPQGEESEKKLENLKKVTFVDYDALGTEYIVEKKNTMDDLFKIVQADFFCLDFAEALAFTRAIETIAEVKRKN